MGALAALPWAVTFGLALAAAPQSVPAAFDEAERQARCELASIGDTRSGLAIRLIHTACNFIAIDSGLLNASNRRYHLCLLQHLPGAQSDLAASRIASACRTTYPP